MSLRLSVPLAAVAALAAVVMGVPSASAAAPTTTTDPAVAAAGWLAQQLVGGDHLVYSFDGKTFDGGTTADVIFALAAAKSGKATIDRAVSYFEHNVAGYTAITDTSGKPGPYDGSIGKTAVAAIVAGADPTRFGGYNLLKTLKTDECTAVSGDPKDFTVPVCPAKGAGRNIYSSISESLIITAEARSSGYAPSAPAVGYLLSLQCADGGFTADTSGGAGCKPDPDATGYAMMALQALGGHSTELAKAAAWLMSTRNSDGSWTSQGGPNVDSTGLAAAGLHAAGRSAAASRDWLAGQQVTSGPTTGKGASRGALKYQGRFDASGSIKATADGLLGLVPGASLATLDTHGAAAGTAVLALHDPSLAHGKVRAGGQEIVTGTGFASGERVRVAVHSTPIRVGTAIANNAGTASLAFDVPQTMPAGAHAVVLTGARSGLSSSVTFTVLAVAAAPTATPTPTPTAPALAVTGRATGWELLVGLGCVALGGLALIAGRRRAAHR